MNPDMSGALMGEEVGGDLDAGMFDEPEEESGMELGAGDETDLDELFAADAQAVFPDMDDTQLLNLQKLIDARIDAKYGPDMGGDIGEGLPEGDLGL
jgi:hypothetical protein